MKFVLSMLAAFITLVCMSVPTAQAQTQTIDLSQLNIGAVVGLPVAIETDGNPATQEWMLQQVFTANRRIVRVTAAGAVCMGPWFAVDLTWQLQRLNTGLHVYTRLDWPLFTVLHLQPYNPTTC